MNKKAFTLIELLAVIIIISIISVITIPIINNSLENSKKRLAVTSAQGYAKTIEEYALHQELNKNKINLDGTYSIDENGYIYNNQNLYQIDYNGEKPQNGILTYNNGELTSACITINNYAITFENGLVTNKEKGDCEKDLQELISQKVDAYVKAALTANSSIEDEEAYTVSYMSDVTTNQPDSGWIRFKKIDSTVTIIDYSLTYGTLTANYQSLTNGTYVSTFSASRSKPIIIGSSVCYGPAGSQECFKVISTNSSTTVLLANNNLKKYTDNSTNPATITYKQDANSPDNIYFAQTNYWMDNNTLISTYSNNGEYSYDSTNYKFVDTNNVRVYPYIYNSNSDTSEYIEGYLDNLKTITYGLPSTATGRLLTYDEANTLDSSIKGNGHPYWLGSAATDKNVSFAYTSSIGSYQSCCGGYGSASVRSVIVISTSDISN